MIERVTFPDWVEFGAEEIHRGHMSDRDSGWTVLVIDPGHHGEIRNAICFLIAKRMVWKFGFEVMNAYAGLEDATAISDSDSEEIAAFESDCYRGCSLTKAEGDEIQARRRSYRATYLEQWRIKQGRVQA